MKLPHTAFINWVSNLRFPLLVGITGALFVLDLLIPDLIPLADEILLGLATAVLARRKKDRGERAGTFETTGQIIDAEVLEEN